MAVNPLSFLKRSAERWASEPAAMGLAKRVKTAASLELNNPIWVEDGVDKTRIKRVAVDPYGVLDNYAENNRRFYLYEPGTPAEPYWNAETGRVEMSEARKNTNDFYRRGERGGITLTAKAMRHISLGRWGKKWLPPYQTAAHREQDPTRREFLFCKLLGVRFEAEAALLSALMQNAETRATKLEAEGAKANGNNIVITDDEYNDPANAPANAIRADKRKLQELYRRIALSDGCGMSSNDSKHFDKSLHKDFLDAAKEYFQKILSDERLAEVQRKADHERTEEERMALRQRKYLEGLWRQAITDEEANDGKYKRAKDLNAAAKEILCDNSVRTFAVNGSICIKHDHMYYVFGTDEQAFKRAYREMILYEQDRSSDAWAMLLDAEGPEWFLSMFDASLREGSNRSPRLGHDEVFLIYGDLTPMVASMAAQQMAKGYWAEEVFMFAVNEETGVCEALLDENGRPRTMVIIMHDPAVTNAAGVPNPQTHINAFEGKRPNSLNDDFVYQPYAYMQKPDKKLRNAVFIPMKDNGLSSKEPREVFDNARLYQSRMIDFKRDNVTLNIEELNDQLAKSGGSEPIFSHAGLHEFETNRPQRMRSPEDDLRMQERRMRDAGMSSEDIQQNLMKYQQDVQKFEEQRSAMIKQQEQEHAIKQEVEQGALNAHKISDVAAAVSGAQNVTRLYDYAGNEQFTNVLKAVMNMERNFTSDSEVGLRYKEGQPIFAGLEDAPKKVEDLASTIGKPDGARANTVQYAAETALKQIEQLEQYNRDTNGQMTEELNKVALSIVQDLAKYNKADAAAVSGVIKTANPLLKSVLGEIKAGRPAFTKPASGGGAASAFDFLAVGGP